MEALVWGDLRQTEHGLEAQDARCPIGHYIAVENGWFLLGQTGYVAAAGLVQSKVAAQADYEHRVLEAMAGHDTK